MDSYLAPSSFPPSSPMKFSRGWDPPPLLGPELHGRHGSVAVVVLADGRSRVRQSRSHSLPVGGGHVPGSQRRRRRALFPLGARRQRHRRVGARAIPYSLRPRTASLSRPARWIRARCRARTHGGVSGHTCSGGTARGMARTNPPHHCLPCCLLLSVRVWQQHTRPYPSVWLPRCQ